MQDHFDAQVKRSSRHRVLAAFAVACAIVCGFSLLGVKHSTIEAWATVSPSHEGRLPYPTAGYLDDPGIDIDAIDWDGVSISETLGDPVEHVQSGTFLVMVAHVHDGDARPIRGVRVVFTLSSETGQQRSVDHTNSRGSASCTRWIPADAQGQPMIVTAEAAADGWVGSSSKWFVPE